MGKFYHFHFRNTDAQKVPQDYIDNKLKNLDLYSSMYYDPNIPTGGSFKVQVKSPDSFTREGVIGNGGMGMGKKNTYQRKKMIS